MSEDPEPEIGLTLQVDSVVGWVFLVGLIVIPVVSLVVIRRIARRHPTRRTREEGLHRGGVRIVRGATVAVIAGAALFGAVVILVPVVDGATIAAVALVASVFLLLFGGLLLGAGWALAHRATWVTFATVVLTDVWLCYVNVLLIIIGDDEVNFLLTVSFAIHAGCSVAGALYAFRARDLNQVARAKAGEAGRTLTAVWVLLVGYSLASVLVQQSAIFDTAAGSAVTAALSIGALAVTLGSGYTKYAEAVFADAD